MGSVINTVGSSGYLVISQAYVRPGKDFSPFSDSKLYLTIRSQPQTQKSHTVRSVTSPLLSSLEGIYGPASINFGVGRYFGDPSEFGVTQLSAYDVLQPITDNNTLVEAAINNWIASGGGDLPEANLYALQQAATSSEPTPRGGLSSGESTGWRNGAKKVIAWFGDASGHQDSVDLNETIDALQKVGVNVVAFNSGSAGSGIDLNFPDGRVAGNQASAIVAATGGKLNNSFTSLTSAQVQAAIVDAIGDVASTIDLDFLVDPIPAGVNVAWTCTDPAGCNDVPGGATRSFAVSFTGTALGTYAFETGFVGISARETDRITVTGDEVPIPTPALLPGLIGMGVAALRKRNQEEGDSAEA